MTLGGHRYRTETTWSGTTAAGYEAYDRSHRATAEGVTAAVDLSGDRAFGGDGSRWNPEQLLVVAASACQLLSFLAVAARARIEVLAYRDGAEGEMPESPAGEPAHLTRIVLRPVITVGPGPDDQRLQHLVQVAHRECFIANSLRTEVVVEARFERSGGD